MNVIVSNRQTLRPVCRPALQTLSQSLAALARLALPGGALTVVLTDNRGIGAMNAACFGQDCTTDVIALRYRPVPPPGAGAGGEILVNVERAVECGPRHGGVHRELALYLAHGIDHLTGADDGTGPGRRQMRRRELRWLRMLDAQGVPLRCTSAPARGTRSCLKRPKRLCCG